MNRDAESISVVKKLDFDSTCDVDTNKGTVAQAPESVGMKTAEVVSSSNLGASIISATSVQMSNTTTEASKTSASASPLVLQKKIVLSAISSSVRKPCHQLKENTTSRLCFQENLLSAAKAKLRTPKQATADVNRLISAPVTPAANSLFNSIVMTKFSQLRSSVTGDDDGKSDTSSPSEWSFSSPMQ